MGERTYIAGKGGMLLGLAIAIWGVVTKDLETIAGGAVISFAGRNIAKTETENYQLLQNSHYRKVLTGKLLEQVKDIHTLVKDYFTGKD